MTREILERTPSEIAELFRFTSVEGMSDSPIVQMSFTGREYLTPIYDLDTNDSDLKGVVFVAARQAEKTATISNIMGVDILGGNARALYVNSSEAQAKRFSSEKIDDLVRNTEILKRLQAKGKDSKYGVFEKHFNNGGIVHLSFASVSADRVRGTAVKSVYCDEIQDMSMDVIPVIRECMGRVLRNSFEMYAGTHKSSESTLAQMYDRSTQTEIAIPCYRHSITGPTGKSLPYYQFLGYENISIKHDSIVCNKCGHPIDHQDPNRILVHTKTEGARYFGLRLPRMATPWCSGSYYKERVLIPYKEYSKQKLYNEVLALTFDSGVKPITKDEIYRLCDEDVSTQSYSDRKFNAKSFEAAGSVNFMGIDHGPGTDCSFTYVTIGSYGVDRDGRRLTLFHCERFTGDKTDPANAFEYICYLIEKYHVRSIGTDVGMGHYINGMLLQRYGAQRVLPVMYVSGLGANPVVYKAGLHRALVNKTFIIDTIVAKLKKKGIFALPCKEDAETFAEDCSALVIEETSRGALLYNRAMDKSDDGIHSFAFLLLASAIVGGAARPDLFAYKIDSSNTYNTNELNERAASEPHYRMDDGIQTHALQVYLDED